MFLEKGRDFGGSWEIRDTTTGRVVVPHVELALTRNTRRQGLLGRDGLPAGHGLVLAPCTSVHTWFMRFPIDVIFVGRSGEVVKTRAAVPAWRLLGAFGAYATIELPAGAIAQSGVERGHRLELVPATP
jgi:uncharacterized membrane protein (UPF0127 family)